MREIPLTKGYVAFVDDEDYERLTKWKWHALVTKNTVYAANKGWKQPCILMHRIIVNAPPDLEVDHRDRNGLHNWRSNLRPCTVSRNHMNAEHRHGSSRYKGVYFHRRDGNWAAMIKKDRKTRFLGYHATERLAALAYNEAAVDLFGEFARLNEVE